jgi:branched-chain amino acid transport system ATP-binding protein
VSDDFEEVLALFPQLKGRLSQMGGTLSGGEQQMLAVGRALMARPRLLCMDEPSLGLAPIIVDELFEKIRQLNSERGQTILIVEQNAFLALESSSRAYVLKTGRITREGPGEALLGDPSIQQEYLGMQQTADEDQNADK